MERRTFATYFYWCYYSILAVSIPVILSGLVQNNSEFGSQPFGGSDSVGLQVLCDVRVHLFRHWSALPLKEVSNLNGYSTMVYSRMDDSLKSHDAPCDGILSLLSYLKFGKVSKQDSSYIT